MTHTTSEGVHVIMTAYILADEICDINWENGSEQEYHIAGPWQKNQFLLLSNCSDNPPNYIVLVQNREREVGFYSIKHACVYKEWAYASSLNVVMSVLLHLTSKTFINGKSSKL